MSKRKIQKGGAILRITQEILDDIIANGGKDSTGQDLPGINLELPLLSEPPPADGPTLAQELSDKMDFILFGAHGALTFNKLIKIPDNVFVLFTQESGVVERLGGQRVQPLFNWWSLNGKTPPRIHGRPGTENFAADQWADGPVRTREQWHDEIARVIFNKNAQDDSLLQRWKATPNQKIYCPGDLIPEHIISFHQEKEWPNVGGAYLIPGDNRRHWHSTGTTSYGWLHQALTYMYNLPDSVGGYKFRAFFDLQCQSSRRTLHAIADDILDRVQLTPGGVTNYNINTHLDQNEITFVLKMYYFFYNYLLIENGPDIAAGMTDIPGAPYDKTYYDLMFSSLHRNPFTRIGYDISDQARIDAGDNHLMNAIGVFRPAFQKYAPGLSDIFNLLKDPAHPISGGAGATELGTPLKKPYKFLIIPVCRVTYDVCEAEYDIARNPTQQLARMLSTCTACVGPGQERDYPLNILFARRGLDELGAFEAAPAGRLPARFQGYLDALRSYRSRKVRRGFFAYWYEPYATLLELTRNFFIAGRLDFDDLINFITLSAYAPPSIDEIIYVLHQHLGDRGFPIAAPSIAAATRIATALRGVLDDIQTNLQGFRAGFYEGIDPANVSRYVVRNGWLAPFAGFGFGFGRLAAAPAPVQLGANRHDLAGLSLFDLINREGIRGGAPARELHGERIYIPYSLYQKIRETAYPERMHFTGEPTLATFTILGNNDATGLLLSHVRFMRSRSGNWDPAGGDGHGNPIVIIQTQRSASDAGGAALWDDPQMRLLSRAAPHTNITGTFPDLYVVRGSANSWNAPLPANISDNIRAIGQRRGANVESQEIARRESERRRQEAEAREERQRQEAAAQEERERRAVEARGRVGNIGVQSVRPGDFPLFYQRLCRLPDPPAAEGENAGGNNGGLEFEPSPGVGLYGGRRRIIDSSRMQRQGGGAYQAPLSYLDNSYREPGTTSDGGSNVLGVQPGLARPVLNPLSGGRRRGFSRKNRNARRRMNRRTQRSYRGGFYPSVMGSFTSNGAALIPATVYSGYKMIKNYNKKTRKGRK